MCKRIIQGLAANEAGDKWKQLDFTVVLDTRHESREIMSKCQRRWIINGKVKSIFKHHLQFFMYN